MKMDLSNLGDAQHFLSPKMSGYVGHWRVDFSTGCTLYVPESLFDNIQFKLGREQAARKDVPPIGGKAMQ